MDVKCIGTNCTAVDGVGHSVECLAEYNKAVHYGAGNRNPEARYAGYKNRPLGVDATDDQKAAWQEGFDARGEIW